MKTEKQSTKELADYGTFLEMKLLRYAIGAYLEIGGTYAQDQIESLLDIVGIDLFEYIRLVKKEDIYLADSLQKMFCDEGAFHG